MTITIESTGHSRGRGIARGTEGDRAWDSSRAIQEEDARRPGPVSTRPEGEEPPPTGTGPGKGTSKSSTANGTGSSASTSTSAGPRAQASSEWSEEDLCSMPRAWEDHLARKGHVSDPSDVRGRTREFSELASAFLKRREAFVANNIADEALDLLRAELRLRGCTDPDALLAGVLAHRQRRAA